MIWVFDLLLLIGVIYLDRRVSGRLYTPLTLFAACWLGPLALRHLNLVDYEALQPRTLVMIYGGFLSFALGYGIIVNIANRFWAPLDDKKLLAPINQNALTVICLMVSSLGLFATYIQVSSVIASRGLIGFILNPLEVREEFMLTGWGALYLVNALLPSLLVLRHRVRGSKLDKWTVLMGLVVVISLILANQKQALVKAGVMAAIVATLCESRVKFRWLAIAGLALLLFFTGYARVTSPYYKGDHRFYVRDGHISLPHALAPLGNPYHYVTSGYGNFQVFVDDLDHLAEGRKSTRPLRYIWQRLQGSREIESHHGRYYYAPLFGNTHTYQRQFYADGGVAGVLIISGLLGAFCAWIFVEIVWRGRIWLAPFYGVVGWCLFISFFSNHWIYFGSWILFAIALMLGLGFSLQAATRRWHGRPSIPSAD